MSTERAFTDRRASEQLLAQRLQEVTATPRRRTRSAFVEAAGQVPHRVEVVALGAVLACVIAALLGVWPWAGGGS